MRFTTSQSNQGSLDLAAIASRADVYLMCLSSARRYLYTFQARGAKMACRRIEFVGT